MVDTRQKRQTQPPVSVLYHTRTTVLTWKFSYINEYSDIDEIEVPGYHTPSTQPLFVAFDISPPPTNLPIEREEDRIARVRGQEPQPPQLLTTRSYEWSQSMVVHSKTHFSNCMRKYVDIFQSQGNPSEGLDQLATQQLQAVFDSVEKKSGGVPYHPSPSSKRHAPNYWRMSSVYGAHSG